MTTTRLVALAACAVLALGGCSDDDPEPQISDPSPNPTSMPSDDETTDPDEPPELPAEATENSKAGAEAFTEYWWDAANFAQATGDTEPLANVSSADCEACQGAIGFVERIYERGGEVTGGENTVEVQGVNSATAGSDRLFEVRFETTNTKQTIRYPSGQPDRFAASTTTGRFILSRSSGAWIVDLWEIG